MKSLYIFGSYNKNYKQNQFYSSLVRSLSIEILSICIEISLKYINRNFYLRGRSNFDSIGEQLRSEYKPKLKQMLTSKVAIVGGGPVGLLGCLLLEKFKIDYLCLEKSEKLRSHPSAHWVSAKSKQIMSQITGLAQTIDQRQETFDHFKYYRYCQAIGGKQFGSTNHFLPSVQEKITSSHKLFGQYPNHISQSKLLNIEYETLKEKQRVIFNQQISSISKTQDGYLLLNSKRETVAKSEYVILSNGFNSSLRSQLGIEVGGGKQLYRLVNIHFKSMELAQLIKRKNCEAMLHFVYNQKIPCVLVNHSLNEGQFVLQIPNYEPFIDLLKVYTPAKLLETAFSSQDFSLIQKNLQIIHVGRWKLQAQIAQKMYQDNIFLAGDAAHTYTPAGGFGMNAGFQDINQLSHTLHLLIRNPNANLLNLKEMYNTDRLNANNKYLQESLKNYKLTEQIANQLGFPNQLAQHYFTLCRFLPQTNISFGMQLSQKMRLLAMKGLFRPKDVKPQLNLFFDQFDHSIQRNSKMMPEIITSVRNDDYFDVWADQSIKKDQINFIFGQIETKNIKRIKMPDGEKIVRRDGKVIQ